MARPTKQELKAVNAQRIASDRLNSKCDHCDRKAVFMVQVEWEDGVFYLCGTDTKEMAKEAVIQQDYADDIRLSSGEYTRNKDGEVTRNTPDDSWINRAERRNCY